MSESCSILRSWPWPLSSAVTPTTIRTSRNERVFWLVELPMKVTQWPAVSTVSGSIKVPPQKCSLEGGLALVSSCSETMNGYLPLGTAVPPTTSTPTSPWSASCAHAKLASASIPTTRAAMVVSDNHLAFFTSSSPREPPQRRTGHHGG